ncbi:Mor transcription activator family protein [Gallaecimonas kandeliae]|uniref:Mor transcription activator family protein n=1 Tax=Gallaecimonas kandeliae TaxID=3029055 RepID=UPI0026473A6C|nr:Mor transcription activator family protein [Gallaecimonas kandeliae]WKE65035.1 Mor transcription activator family protein [Gallaecimonas kandeliae]
MSDNQMGTRRHELLEDIHAQVAKVAQEFGIKEDVADQVGCAIADHLAENWGGQNFTIPMDHHYRISQRDAEIYDRFNGRNHHVLAKEFNMTVRGIYKVIKRVRAKGDPNQPGLF